jgi:hypothetical protein
MIEQRKEEEEMNPESLQRSIHHKQEGVQLWSSDAWTTVGGISCMRVVYVGILA